MPNHNFYRYLNADLYTWRDRRRGRWFCASRRAATRGKRMARKIVAARASGRTYDEIAKVMRRRDLVGALNMISLGRADWRRPIIIRVRAACTARMMLPSPGSKARVMGASNSDAIRSRLRIGMRRAASAELTSAL